MRRPDTQATVIVAIGLLVTALVFLIDGIDGIALWNVAPVAAVSLVLATGRWVRKPLPGVGTPVMVFCVTTLSVVALAHLEWHFDWGGAQTGSSTSALAFLFIPFWAVGLGAIGFAAILLGRTFTRREQGA
jgi:hypothetical protein